MFRSPVLDDIRSNIHTKPIPWKGLNRAKIVTEDEGQSFETLGKLGSAERQERVRADAEKYADLVVQLLSREIRDDLFKYLLLFVVEYGESVPEFAQALAAKTKSFPLFNSFFEYNDEQITVLTALSISVQATSGTLAPLDVIESLYRFTIQHLLLTSSNNVNYKDLGAQILDVLLQDQNYRTAFHQYEHEAIPAVLALVASAPLQIQYTSLLVLWILSFDKQSAVAFTTEYNVVSVVLDTAKSALKEKIVRLSLAILSNIVRFARKQAIPVLIAEGALSTTNLLSARKWNDEELVADLTFVKNELTQAYDSMTTFEEYEAELKTSKLRWTPVHRNKAFWIENIQHFKDHDWTVLKDVLQLLEKSDDSVTLAVACHDIAAIVGQDSDASEVITKVGGKVRLMQLIANPDTEVRYEALKATQKMLAHIFA